ncbi:MAG: hypothetical protein ACLRMN_12910 [Mediterraneibacter gnavus]
MDMINEIGRWLQEKEVLPTALERLGMADKLAEIVLISLGITVLLGILSCFFGLKLARFWSFLTVFVIGTGAAAAVAMQITSDETLSGIIGLAAGIILAIVFAILKRAGMFVTAFVLGAALSIYWLRPANLIWLLVCVGIGLVFALLTIKLFVPVLMLLTGVTGAVCISQAGTVLLGHAGVELERWMVTLAFAVLAVLGILVQFLMESGKRQKLHLKKLRRFANRIPQRMKWIKPELFWMKSLKKKSRQRKKYIQRLFLMQKSWKWNLKMNLKTMTRMRKTKK